MTLLFGRVWIPLAVILYVAFAALQLQPRSGSALCALLLSPLIVILTWRRTEPANRRANTTEGSALTATRAALSGALLWLAARSGPAGHPAFDAAANVGTATCTLGALVALARISGPRGLIVPAKMTRSLDATVFAGFLWSVATTLPVIRATVHDSVLRIHRLTIDYATTTASFANILLILAATIRLRLLRRFELGVADRCNGAVSAAVTAVLFAVPAALLDFGAPDRSVPAVLMLMALAQCWIATTPDPTLILRWLRSLIAVLALGAPVTLLGSILLRNNPSMVGWVLPLVAVWSVTVGILARTVAKPLEPEQSRWLVAIEKAVLAALEPEPSDALRAALSELSRINRDTRLRSELWNVDPPVVKFVDIAGQLHERTAALPERLTEFAASEPENTLRSEVLRAVQIRRADVRPLISWFETQGVFCATVLQSETGPLGALCLPSGGRRSPLALEEAQALSRLCMRIGALLAVSAAQARSRQRELLAIDHCAQVEVRLQRAELTASLELDGHRQGSRAMARSIRSSCFAPLSRIALEQVERLAAARLSQALVLPLGADARGWAAVAHCASPRRDGPFVIADPVNTSDYPKPWVDSQRGRHALGGGNLVLVNPVALDFESQQAIETWLSERSSESVPDIGCILVVRASLMELVASRRIIESLARRFAGVETEIPRLADRGDDVRAMVIDRLARLGMSLYGAPRAADPAALAEFLNYDWPGNESELDSTLLRLIQKAKLPLITLDDLEQIGFSATSPEDRSGTPLPAVAMHRAPHRATTQRPR